MENDSDPNKDHSLDRQNVSFKFTRKVPKTLSGNKLNEHIKDSKHEKDFVFSVDKSEIKSSAPKNEEKELIIPLIKKNKWRVLDTPSAESNDVECKLKEMAVQELLKESKEKNEQWEKGETVNDMAIPLIMQNKVPEGFETDEKMDVSLRPEESTLDDYDRIPIEKFGMAILKGMGWKEGDPVGANAKIAAKPIQVQLRPKGLGLGADTSALNKLKEKKKGDEKLELVKGAYVHITQGSNKGFYGEVLGLDEENARVIVKISGKDKAIVTFPEFSVEVVSKKEFEKESKVINRAAYEKYKRVHEENKESESRSREKSRKDKEREKSSREKKRSCDSVNTDERDSDRRTDHSKKKRTLENSSRSHKSDKHSSRTWVKPQLKVRLIDQEYKKGKYFNEKLIVVDVLSSKNCTCRTENDKYLEDISPSMLETVIPRSENSYVMIVQGKYSGELCTILEKNKSKCLATVQLLSDRDQAVQIEYDSISEYVGDVSAFD